MCGIAGRVHFDSERPVERALLQRMCAALAHRGPDGEGIWLDGPVGLAHRRLAVIDPSEAGRQPMANEDDSVWLTCNGEIYDFDAHRAELTSRGHRFRSRSDSEVLVHLWEERGPDCLEVLRGMFAFALWDARSGTLFLARDRFGKKPLYYWLDEEKLVFASEPKAIFQDEAIRAEVDPAAIDHYLAWGYVPAAGSAFRGLVKLPPAHYLLLRDGRVTLRRWWELHYEPKRELPEPAAREELLARMRAAVQRRLRSDVPLGVFLSGGVDSSGVAALAREATSGRLETFAVGFDEREYDEIPYARAVARQIGSEHHEFVVRPDAAALLPKIVWHYNEPFADSSAIPTYILAECTRRHVTVVLTGDGGDEAFAGYPRHLASQIGRVWDRLPAAARAGLARAVGRLPRGAPASFSYRAHRLAEALAEEPHLRYARWLTYFDSARRVRLYRPEFAARVSDSEPLEAFLECYRRSDASDPVDANLDVDTRLYLPEDLLVKVDIATMAHGLEARAPLLDHELVEFVARLPARYKLRGRAAKWLLKRALRGLVPRTTLRRAKMGFGVPIDRWLRAELREFARDTLLSARALGRGYFRPEEVRRLLEEHATGRRSWHYPLWNLLMLELWHVAFIDRAARV